MKKKSKRKAESPANLVDQMGKGAIASVYQKVLAGEEVTAKERKDLARYEKKKEDKARWEHYEAIPLAHWRKMSGLSTVALRHYGKEYGLPFEGDTVDLTAFVKGVYTLLAKMPGKVVRTRDAVARHFGSSVRTVAYWLGRGMPGEEGHYDLEAIEQWRDEEFKGGADDESEIQRRRIRQIELELREIDLKKASGAFIDVEIIRRLFVRHIHEAKAILDQIPDRMLACLPERSDGKIKREVLRRTQGAVDAAYTMLADSIEEIDRERREAMEAER